MHLLSMTFDVTPSLDIEFTQHLFEYEMRATRILQIEKGHSWSRCIDQRPDQQVHCFRPMVDDRVNCCISSEGEKEGPTNRQQNHDDKL